MNLANSQSCRPGKGKEILLFPQDYTVIDLETTGLDFEENEIIEFGAIRVRGGRADAEFHSLVRPASSISERITSLTGISNEMTEQAPAMEEIAANLRTFLGSDLLLGHSVDFDITFLYDVFEKNRLKLFDNPFIDTFPISQRLLPELHRRRLADLAAYYGIDASGAHRAPEDCRMNYAVFEAMKKTITRAYGSVDNFIAQWEAIPRHWKASQVTAPCGPFKKHPLLQKHCAFTGLLYNITRREAMQMVAKVGGFNVDKVTSSTDILILGKPATPEQNLNTGKYKKALRLIHEGQSIAILDERQFLNLFSDQI